MTPAERTAAHEAGHACACLTLGVPVRLVDTIGDARYSGWVRHDLEDIKSHGDARKRMVVILCGPLEGAENWDEVPSWPLNPNASTDEYNLAVLADWLGLDQRGYEDIYLEALKLSIRPEFRMLHLAMTGMLDYVPRLGPELVAQLETIARRNTTQWNI